MTQGSSANQNDINSGSGYITIDYKSLDEHNKKVYEDLLKRKIATPYNTIYYECDCKTDVIVAQPFMIEVPLDENTDSADFSNLMLEIAKEFAPQEVLYSFYTTQEMEKMAKDSLHMCVQTNNNVWEFEDYLFSKYDGEVKLSNIVADYKTLKNYYYDEDSNRYWISEDLYRKSINNEKINIL